jgi:hypothetical protein
LTAILLAESRQILSAHCEVDVISLSAATRQGWEYPRHCGRYQALCADGLDPCGSGGAAVRRRFDANAFTA